MAASMISLKSVVLSWINQSTWDETNRFIAVGCLRVCCCENIVCFNRYVITVDEVIDEMETWKHSSHCLTCSSQGV
ncbi:hypothetical protein PPL_11632 [Heterostelium album PN500]|uniref:Uncharacterized protein n=1 Tax=Heterostelium pallidum (strain ATCC 26659 / Pp 5 / PN500) TaxID=670386 RepID=D3BVA6_HETP5|nr:hypothetical protein PPL_11632 [Heterostelium album PN500]EFA74663.1 hypothetical protein PPL_11632 [Heterostelium album PN500]|eukprot:XP_020426797.1 hypothetical protein PPL_11632 [Heterostelium album PN500]